MSSATLIDFFTSGTGLFAAVLVLLALLGVVLKIVLPFLAMRRMRPELSLSALRMNPPPPWSETGSLEFTIQNEKGGKAVMMELLLSVREHGACAEAKMLEGAAPLPHFSHNVRLAPNTALYDVRAKESGSAQAHRFAPGEVEAYLVELTSTAPQWYDLDLVVRWFDVADSDKLLELRGHCPRIEFMSTVEELLAFSADP